MGGKLSRQLNLTRSETDLLSNTRVSIICAEWHSEITHSLLNAVIEILNKYSIQSETVKVPGAFELPFAAKWSLQHNNPDGVICLGCVIKGDTDHNQYINQAVSNAIMQLNLEGSIPVIFGLLTVDTAEQALERSGGILGNKGEEAAIAAIQMILLKKSSFTKHG